MLAKNKKKLSTRGQNPANPTPQPPTHSPAEKEKTKQNKKKKKKTNGRYLIACEL